MPTKCSAAGAMIILQTLLLGGCTSTVTAYEGPARSDGEVAIVKTGFSIDGRVVLEELDGTALRGTDEKPDVTGLTLVPGNHTIKAVYEFSCGLVNVESGRPACAQYYSHEILQIDFERGKTYVIRAKNRSMWTQIKGADMWIEDAATNKVLGGTKR